MNTYDSNEIPCNQVLASLVFIIEGAANEIQNPASIQGHINDCPNCQSEVVHEKAVKTMMQDVLRRSCDEEAPADLKQSIHEQLLAQMSSGVSSLVTQYSMTEISIEIDEFGNVEHREIQIEQTHIQHFKDEDDVS